MLHSVIDHLVITAPSLTEGQEFIRQLLGVEMQKGGEHQSMGTHNMVLRLGDQLYLEIIAVNPKAISPDRKRWFGLDDRRTAMKPELAAWVVRTNDLIAAQRASNIELGIIESMNRGEFNWLITVPQDGSLPFHGIVPVLIQWSSKTHPASMLRESDCSLVFLEGFHPDADKINQMLKSIGFEGKFSVSVPAEKNEPHLIAHILTPRGECEISI